MINPFPIFVVDDDKEDQFILHEYFSEVGSEHKIKYFDNGRLVIEYLEAIAEDSQLPKLIVLDLNMPVLNGTQTLLQIKRVSRYKNIAVIIYSTSQNDNEKRKCLSFGAVDYVVKPITMEEGEAITKKFMSFLET